MHIKDFDPYDFSKKEINGVPVYWKNLPWAPCVHIRIVFNVGAFNDPVGKEGLAHFLEHMIFQGCPSMPNEKAIREFEKMYTLDSLNAYTSSYKTVYHAKCLPEYTEKVLIGMKDMIFNSYLRPENVEHERHVITQETWRYFKNEKYLAYMREVGNILYPHHNRSRNMHVLGWPETVIHITQEDVHSFHVSNYGKQNMMIVLVGSVTEEHLNLVKNFLQNIKDVEQANPQGGEIEKPSIHRLVKNADEIGDPQEQVEFSLIRPQEKRLGLKENKITNQTQALLYDVLFEKLRTELNLCYGVSVGLHQFKDYEEAVISVRTKEDKLEVVEKEIWNILSLLSDSGYKEKFEVIHGLHLQQTKSHERASDYIANIAVEEISTEKKIYSLKESLIEEENVTHEDVVKLVKKTFDPEYVFTEIILPTKK